MWTRLPPNTRRFLRHLAEYWLVGIVLSGALWYRIRYNRPEDVFEWGGFVLACLFLTTFFVAPFVKSARRDLGSRAREDFDPGHP